MTKLPVFFRRAGKNLANIARRIPSILLANLLVTRRCTQRCLQCTIPDGAGDDSFMPFDTFAALVDCLDRHGTHFISISGGEPLLHPDLPDMIRLTAGKRFLYLQLLTNLYGAEDARDRIIDVLFETGTGIQVSFDGFGEVADRLRGADEVAARVMSGINLIDRENKKRRQRIRTSLNIVLSKLNLGQVPDLVEFAESLGWKMNVDLYRCSSETHRGVDMLLIDDLEALDRAIEHIRRSPSVTTPRMILDGYRRFLEGTHPKRCPYLECPSFVTKVFIWPDGETTVCINGTIGNLLTMTPGEIFSSETWRRRVDLMKHCPGCWNTCYTPSAITFHPQSRADMRVLWEILKKR
ncbi:radical SAM protein [Candidatus Latescibacterota bacterium]